MPIQVPGPGRGRVGQRLKVVAPPTTTGRRLIVGNLGHREFPQEYHIYLGGALNGLDIYLRRYPRRDKKPHWYLDGLTNAVTVIENYGVRWRSAGSAFELRRL